MMQSDSQIAVNRHYILELLLIKANIMLTQGDFNQVV